jgi:hypothetical protein
MGYIPGGGCKKGWFRREKRAQHHMSGPTAGATRSPGVDSTADAGVDSIRALLNFGRMTQVTFRGGKPQPRIRGSSSSPVPAPNSHCLTIVVHHSNLSTFVVLTDQADEHKSVHRAG